MVRHPDIQETIAMASEPSDPFTHLPVNEWRDVFFTFSEEVQERLIVDMSPVVLETFIHRLDPDEVTAVLWFTDDETRESQLARLDSERREKIEFLLSFDPETAAGVMSLDFVTVDKAREVIEQITHQ